MMILGLGRSSRASSSPPAEVGTPITTFHPTGTVGTSGTVNISSLGLIQGDLAIGCVASDNTLQGSTGNGGGAAGWTSINTPLSDLFYLQAAYKVMGATPDTTFPIWFANRQQPVIVFGLRGVHASVLDGSFTFAYIETGGGSADPASQTTSFANSMRVIVAMVNNSNLTGWTAPAGFGSLKEAASSASGSIGSTLAVALRAETSPGANDPAAFGGITGTAVVGALHFAVRAA